MAIKKKKVTPRQKMINLMYVVLMAMLALNVSSDVLNGFSLVDESLNRTTANATKVNQDIYKSFEEEYKKNPAKTKEWYDKAQHVRKITENVFKLVEELKVAIVKQSDGPEGDVHKIVNREDLEAAAHVMLAPVGGRGKELHQAIDKFREEIVKMVNDPVQQKIIRSNLSTEVPKSNDPALQKDWEHYMFETMPTSAAVTMLTKLQSDIRYAEGEVLHTLVSNIGLKDIRVNEVNAYVVPQALMIEAGGRFSADIFMAAVDTLNRPTVYVNGTRLNGSHYEAGAGGVGEHTISGYVEMKNASGEIIRRDFSQKYTVYSPARTGATVSADMMNVLYAGIDNPMSVSVSGASLDKVSMSMSGGGSLTSQGAGHYVARPTEVGGTVTFNVSANIDGASRSMGQFSFKVRKLPDPFAFIAVGGDKFTGGRISKAGILGATHLSAAIDDGLLNIPFTVTGFETVFFDAAGNAIPEKSAGSSFTEGQRNLVRQLSRGKRFYISKITATGPDGVARTLKGAIEVIVN